ncbi:unnamed protein product, partial [Phaeothamnion confervicola]
FIPSLFSLSLSYDKRKSSYSYKINVSASFASPNRNRASLWPHSQKLTVDAIDILSCISGEMERILADLAAPETKRRLRAVDDCAADLAGPSGLASSGEWQQLPSALVGCLRDNNSKVCTGALRCLEALMRCVGSAVRPYLSGVIPPVAERLGNAKAAVRDAGVDVLVAASSEGSLGPTALLDALRGFFGHNNHRVRETLHRLLARLATTPAAAAELAAKRPQLAPLLAAGACDPSGDVRLAAVGAAAALLTVMGPTFHSLLKDAGMRPTALKAVAKHRAAAASAGDCAGGPAAASGDAVSISLAPGAAKAMTPSASDGGGIAATQCSTGTRPKTAESIGGCGGGGASSGAVGPRQRGRTEDSGGGCHGADFDALEPLCPTALYSERELLVEVDAARALLAHLTDWRSWVGGLQRLAGAALGAAGQYDAALVAAVRATLHDAVSLRIADLRSAVTREACRCVAVVAHSTGDAFAPLAELWLPPLLRNTANAKDVIAASGDVAIRAIITATAAGFPRLLPPLVAGAGGKVAAVRRACIAYVRLALIRWSDAALAPPATAAAVAGMVARGVADPDEEVRTAARRTYWALRRRFPAVAEGVWRVLDAGRQRRLNEELSRFDVDAEVRAAAADADGDGSGGGTGRLAGFGRQPPAGTGAGAARVGERADAAGRVAAAAAVAAATSAASAATAAGAGAGLGAPGAAHGAQPDRKARAARRMTMGGPMRVGGASAAAFTEPDRSNMGSDDGMLPARLQPFQQQQLQQHAPPPPPSPLNGDGAAVGDAAVGVAAVNATIPGAGAAPAQSGPQRVARSGPSAPVRVQRADSVGMAGEAAVGHPGGAMRVPRAVPRDAGASASAASAAAATPAVAGACSTDGPSAIPPGALINDAGASAAGPQRVIRQGTGAEAESVRTSETDAAKRRQQQLDQLKELLGQAREPHWEKRVSALVGMHRLLTGGGDGGKLAELLAGSGGKGDGGGSGPTAALRRWEMVESCVVERVADGHYKVATAALDLLLALRLHSLLLPVFARLGDGKEAVRTVAVAVLDACRRAYAPLQLCAALLPKLLELPADRARAGLLEFVLALAPHSAGYLGNPVHQRSLVLKLGTLLRAGHGGNGGGGGHSGGGGGHGEEPTAAAAAARLLVALQRLDADGFVTAVAALPHDVGYAVRRTLATQLPDLDHRIGAHLRTQQDSGRTTKQATTSAMRAPAASAASAPPAASAAGARPFRGGVSSAGPAPALGGNAAVVGELPDSDVAVTPGFVRVTAISPFGAAQRVETLAGTPAATARLPFSEARTPISVLWVPQDAHRTPQAAVVQAPKIAGRASSGRRPLQAVTNVVALPGGPPPPPPPLLPPKSAAKHPVATTHAFGENDPGADGAATAAGWRGSSEAVDAAAAAAEIVTGLARGAAQHRKAAALKTLRWLVDGGDAAGADGKFWDRYFGQFLTALLDGADPQPPLPAGGMAAHAKADEAAWVRQELAAKKYLQALRCLLARQPARFRPVAETVVGRLLESAARGGRTPGGAGGGAGGIGGAATAARLEISAALAALMAVLEPERSLATLLPHLLHPEADAAAAADPAVAVTAAAVAAADVRCEALRALGALARRLPSPCLLEALRATALLPALEAALLDPADLLVRQLAVRAVVEMYQVLGEALLPFLVRMPKPRLKLITIYIEKRAQEARVAAAAARRGVA